MNYKGGIVFGKEYHREYARKNLVYNKFTGKQEKYTGKPCPAGLVRHHVYYNMADINDGIVFITASEHMTIHQAIRGGKLPEIPVME